MSNKGYKLVIRDSNNNLKSFHRLWSDSATLDMLTYDVGKTMCAPQGTLLLYFDSLQNASNFMAQYQHNTSYDLIALYECRVGTSCNINFLVSDNPFDTYASFWKDWWKFGSNQAELSDWYSPAPTGTRGTNKITLIQLVV